MNEDSFTVQMRLPDQSFRSFNKAALEREVLRNNSPMPAYKFNNRDLDDLLSYLSSLTSPSGTDGSTAEEEKRR